MESKVIYTCKDMCLATLVTQITPAISAGIEYGFLCYGAAFRGSCLHNV